MFLVISTSPVFDNRDAIVGSRSSVAHPYAFENLAYALAVAARLQTQFGEPEGFADDRSVSVIDASTGHAAALPVVEVATSVSEDNIPF